MTARNSLARGGALSVLAPVLAGNLFVSRPTGPGVGFCFFWSCVLVVISWGRLTRGRGGNVALYPCSWASCEQFGTWLNTDKYRIDQGRNIAIVGVMRRGGTSFLGVRFLAGVQVHSINQV